MSPGKTSARFYGRRSGHKLRPGRRRLLEARLPALSVPVPEDGAPPLDPRTLFDPRPEEAWLEIGFGAGEHLAAQANAHPEIGFVGCEPFVNGVAALIARIEADGLENVRIFADDARLLLGALADEAFTRIFVLFPDPWPKTRHRKRRLVSPETLGHFARLLADGGELRFATDDAGYLGEALALAHRTGAFAWAARGPRDWRGMPADWIRTRYQEKAEEDGRRGYCLVFRRRPRAAAGDELS